MARSSSRSPVRRHSPPAKYARKRSPSRERKYKREDASDEERRHSRRRSRSTSRERTRRRDDRRRSREHEDRRSREREDRRSREREDRRGRGGRRSREQSPAEEKKLGYGLQTATAKDSGRDKAQQESQLAKGMAERSGKSRFDGAEDSPKPSNDKGEEAEKPKEKANFNPSGKLAEDTNMYKGVLIKYNEPADSKKPNLRWRLYPFKGEEALPVMYVHRQSAYLIGRERRVADIPVDHPSCSKQHAVLQYRSVVYEKSDGSKGRHVRPYIIDLESGNGTYLNGSRIDPRRFIELKEKDVLKFGFSTREFVVLNERSTGDAEDGAASGGSPAGSDVAPSP